MWTQKACYKKKNFMQPLKSWEKKNFLVHNEKD